MKVRKNLILEKKDVEIINNFHDVIGSICEELNLDGIYACNKNCPLCECCWMDTEHIKNILNNIDEFNVEIEDG